MKWHRIIKYLKYTVHNVSKHYNSAIMAYTSAPGDTYSNLVQILDLQI